MKKALTLALVAVLAVSLVACGGKIKDGTYKAEYKNASHGATEFLEVTYKDGAIADVNFDAKLEDGTMKSAMTDEAYGMGMGEMAGKNPVLSAWIPELEANVKKAGTADKIEVVAGATNSSNSAKELMAAVEAQAKAGKTDTAVVENAAE
ncbi:MAG: FMN-binding protein [Oscillospiraceae bacterium]